MIVENFIIAINACIEFLKLPIQIDEFTVSLWQVLVISFFVSCFGYVIVKMLFINDDE